MCACVCCGSTTGNGFDDVPNEGEQNENKIIISLLLLIFVSNNIFYWIKSNPMSKSVVSYFFRNTFFFFCWLSFIDIKPFSQNECVKLICTIMTRNGIDICVCVCVIYEWAHDPLSWSRILYTAVCTLSDYLSKIPIYTNGTKANT